MSRWNKWNRTGYIRKDGYRQIRVNGEQILEHRHIFQRLIGRKLRSNEVIHHKNRIKLDNRIENLELTNHKDHCSMHHPKNMSKCSITGCENTVMSRELCRTHYLRKTFHGTPYWIPLRVKRYESNSQCKVKNCVRKTRLKKGYCENHYQKYPF